jgi:hypothetical protein
MPPAGRSTRRRRAAFRGHFFTTTVARLGPHLRGLEASLAHLLPELFDGTVADRLVTYLDPHAGPGVAVAPGHSLPRGTVVGLYFGDVLDTTSTPRGDYVLDLGRVRRGGRVHRLLLDGARRCSRRGGAVPDLRNAALLNHTRWDASVRLGRPARCDFPCAVAYTTRRLEAGDPLRWDYDGGRSGAAFTVDAAEGARLLAQGVTCVPCACRGGQPCPRQRWFPIYGGV